MRPSLCARVLEREFLAATAGVHTPVMLWGPPGVGKSQLVSAVAAQHAVRLVDMRLAQLEPTDLRGIPFRDGASISWAPPVTLPRADRDGPRGILFLDEITSALPTVTAAAYQLILDRRLGEYQVPPGWAILAAGNRHGDRGVTYAMPAPLANRFAHYEIEPDLDDWVQWAIRQGVDARLIAFLRFRPDLLLAFDPARSSAAFPSPRSWEFVNRALAKFGDDPVLQAESVNGCVGAAAGLALRAYLEHVAGLPDPALIIAGEVNAAPRTVELQYAVATSLARYVERLPEPARAAAVNRSLEFARTFPTREIGVMLVVDLARGFRQPLYSLAAFAPWANEVGDLLSRDVA